MTPWQKKTPNEQVESCHLANVSSWANWQSLAKTTVFERESAAFGWSGGDRAPAVGPVLLVRKSISCNQMLWITVLVSSALATEAMPRLVQRHYLVLCKTSSDILNKEMFRLLHFVSQNTAYCCFETESYDFVSDYICKALFREGKENDCKKFTCRQKKSWWHLKTKL